MCGRVCVHALSVGVCEHVRDGGSLGWEYGSEGKVLSMEREVLRFFL